MALAKLAWKPSPELAGLTYESPNGDWQCQHDRRWNIYRQAPKSPVAVLRLVDRGMLAGQCNLASLADHDPGKLVSLAEFQEDVRRALDKSFGEFVEASESSNAAQYRIYRVVVHGTASDLAMRWIYYLVAEPQGRQVALTFTVEQKLVERFADADKAMVQSLRFAESKKRRRKERHRRGGQRENRDKVSRNNSINKHPCLRKKNRRVLRCEGPGGKRFKLLADCDWMRRCETSEGQACFCTSRSTTLAHANWLAPPSEYQARSSIPRNSFTNTIGTSWCKLATESAQISQSDRRSAGCPLPISFIYLHHSSENVSRHPPIL